MTQPDTPLPSDAAIEEALRRIGSMHVVDYVRKRHNFFRPTIELARMIEKHEPETLVDAVTRAAREAYAEFYQRPDNRDDVFAGKRDGDNFPRGFRAGAAWQRENSNEN